MGPSVVVGLTIVGMLVGGADSRPISCQALLHVVAASLLAGETGSRCGWLHGRTLF